MPVTTAEANPGRAEFGIYARSVEFGEILHEYWLKGQGGIQGPPGPAGPAGTPGPMNYVQKRTRDAADATYTLPNTPGNLLDTAKWRITITTSGGPILMGGTFEVDTHSNTQAIVMGLALDGTPVYGSAGNAQSYEAVGIATSTIGPMVVIAAAGTHTIDVIAWSGPSGGVVYDRVAYEDNRLWAVELTGAMGGQGPAGPTGATGPAGATGATGPAGPTGATGATGSPGATGPTGSTGPAGTPGSVWYAGSGAPSAGTGVNGDWYLNTANGDAYQKVSGTWTLQVDLQIPGPTGPTGPTGSTGATGSAGAPGSVWYQGAGAPASGTGIVGDWYLNTTTGDVYQKTGASTWTLQGNIKGPTGSTGSTGAPGAAGSQILSGSGAPAGATGAVGDWYIDTATGQTYKKTGASTWTVQLDIQNRWLSGSGVPAGGTGDVGDYYLNTANGDVYSKTGASTWTLQMNLKGPTGASGAPNKLYVAGDGGGQMTLGVGPADLPRNSAASSFFSGSFTGTGRDVMVWFNAIANIGSNAAFRIWANLDGTDIGGRLLYESGLGQPFTITGFQRIPALAVGTHTIKLRYAANVTGQVIFNDQTTGGTTGDGNICHMWCYEV